MFVSPEESRRIQEISLAKNHPDILEAKLKAEKDTAIDFPENFLRNLRRIVKLFRRRK